MQHNHDFTTSHPADTDPGGFIKAFFEHVRDDHGHAIDNRTPWQQVTDLHRHDHATNRNEARA